jgi:hypothetical protein
MSINPHRDTLISIAQASKIFPSINGKSKSIKSIYRYTTTGVRGVVLDSYVNGNAVCTTADAVKEFLAKVAAKRSGNSPSVSRQESDLSRKRSVAKATQKADRLLSKQSA